MFVNSFWYFIFGYLFRQLLDNFHCSEDMVSWCVTLHCILCKILVQFLILLCKDALEKDPWSSFDSSSFVTRSSQVLPHTSS